MTGNWLAEHMENVMDKHTPRGVVIPMREVEEPEKRTKQRKTKKTDGGE